ncbi:MAG: CoA synthetase [Proteobacteria bacterium]|nr:CoA synthetase [Pseudomonadota bacterium]
MACRPEELLIALLARLIGEVRHVAVGNLSPIPAAGALLARKLAARPLQVTLLGSRRDNHFTDGGRELFDCAAQGRIDVFFLGGGQIDGEANLNLVGVGDYPGMTARFPGSFGSAYLYFLIPRVILFREEHSPRVLVPRVDFVSAPGSSPANVYRPGGPSDLVTGAAHFAFDRTRRRFRLVSVHPGQDADGLAGMTGFDYDRPETVATTPLPEPAVLEAIRGPVAARLAESYPRFVERVFGPP